MPARFVTFRDRDRVCVGGVSGDGIVDLTPGFGSLREILAQDRLQEARDAIAGGKVSRALSDLQLMPPVPDAEKYLCIGVNYRTRNAEYADGSRPPAFPSVFMRTRESFDGHDRPVLRPPESEQLDYEGEIAMVIGRGGRRIPEQAALEAVAGYTLVNEGTVRDWVRHGKFNVTQGKNFDKSGAMGPWMITVDAVDDVDNLELQTRVNGELRQSDTTANLLFSFRYLIAYLSLFTTLKPGDVIATGTPNGAGVRFDPPRYLKPRDRIEIQCPAIGTLINTVADEPVP